MAVWRYQKAVMCGAPYFFPPDSGDYFEILKVGQRVLHGAFAIWLMSQLYDLLVDSRDDGVDMHPHESVNGTASGLAVEIPNNVAAHFVKVE
jgi:hypothetical protein